MFAVAETVGEWVVAVGLLVGLAAVVVLAVVAAYRGVGPEE